MRNQIMHDHADKGKEQNMQPQSLKPLKRKQSFIRVLPLMPLIALTITLQSCTNPIHKLGGNFRYKPEEMKDTISEAASRLIKNAFEGNEGRYMIDYHTHIIGLGTSCEACFVHPNYHNTFSPLQRFQFSIYMSASGIKDPDNADEEYVKRLVELIRATDKPMKSAILAFDKHYNKDGSENLEKTQFYVPNSYVFELSQTYPDCFIPVISIHPYRTDATSKLEFWANQGVKIVKWLPNAMGIDPSSDKARAFYEAMRAHNMILLAHAGHEQAVHAAEDQELGNPLLLRTALDHGVRVIMAHCASLGTCTDLDSSDKSEIDCFDLFLRMMDETKYEGLLYGDISALLQYNRLPTPLKVLLSRQDLHSRLVNGTDYPLVAINALIRTSELERDGFITARERKLLNEIYDYNPLLFEYVLKRTVRLPETGEQFSEELFFRNLLDSYHPKMSQFDQDRGVSENFTTGI